jgi:membrane-associated protease RseP (regulator of RpoE activity)
VNWLYLLGVVVFVVGLLVAIGLHEVGHMVPAKRFGVRVTQYMIGFGPTAWSRKIGDTEYGMKWIPLGGYIRMIGMFPPAPDGRLRDSTTGPFRSMVDEARAVSLREVGPDDEGRVFYRKPWWQKVVIMTGGPFMNFVQAFILFAVVLMGFGVATLTTTVASVPECVLTVAEAESRIDPATGELECLPTDPASPAAEAGLQPGDEIVSVAGVPANDWDTVSRTIRAHGDETVDVVVERDGQELTLSAALITSERPDLDDPETLVSVGYLGISPTEELVRQPITAVPAQMWDFTRNTAVAIISIPQRMVGVWQAAFGGGERDIDGPIGIVGAGRIGGEFVSSDAFATQEKVASMLALLASLNMALGVFNLLPLLPLDGGHIAGALYEAGRRGVARLLHRPDPGYFDVAKLLPVAYAVAVLVIGMSALLLYADIVNPVKLPL